MEGQRAHHLFGGGETISPPESGGEMGMTMFLLLVWVRLVGDVIVAAASCVCVCVAGG